MSLLDSRDYITGGAIAAGILVPLFAIGLLAAGLLIGYYFWRKRRGKRYYFHNLL